MALDCSRSPSSPSRSHWRLREGGREGGGKGEREGGRGKGREGGREERREGGREGRKEGGREGGRGEGREEFRKWEVQCDWIELCIV